MTSTNDPRTKAYRVNPNSGIHPHVLHTINPGGKHEDLAYPPEGTDPARRQGYRKVGTHPATDLLCYSARGSLEAKYILIEHDVRNQETDSDGCVIHCA